MFKNIHLPYYEKVWLTIGSLSLVVFLVILGVLGVGLGLEPPGQMRTLPPEQVQTTAPFNQPQLVKTAPNEYKATMVAQLFTFLPNELEIPAGATVHFEVTSPDVVHGLYIPNTNVNIMAVPGHIAEFTYTFKEAGDYLILCHEYCGSGHQVMMGKLKVV
jgi:cytochrome c oxidase subunit 2